MSWTVTSPDGQVAITLHLSDAGSPTYEITHHGATVVGSSALGLRVAGHGPLGSEGLTADGEDAEETVAVDDPVPHGKHARITADGRTRRVWFSGGSAPAGIERFGVELFAYDQGVALRYLLEGTGEVSFDGELTAFHLPQSGRAWIQPMQEASVSCYEDYYTDGVPIGTASTTQGWYLPATFQTGASWLVVHEAGLDRSFYGAKLEADAAAGTYTFMPPHPDEGLGVGEVAVAAELPWRSPWRTFTVTDSAVQLLETDLVHVLPEAPTGDFSYVRPGRASWSWWSEPTSSRDLERMKDYVDLAEEFGFEFSLFDADWQVSGEDNVAAAIADARDRGVGIWLWYNSGGPHNTVTAGPADIMDDAELRRKELAKLASWGVAGIKVDFFHSDKSDRIAQYLGILEDAHAHGIMVNFHGSTVPRGWSRTWPNLMSMEAIRGAEQYGWSDFGVRAPRHNTVVPFTRNLAGPMDYTPVTFTDKRPDKLTTDAHELALAVVFESGVQHIADSDHALRAVDPAVQAALRAVPAHWHETRGLEGEPSSHVVIARRLGEQWFVAGINGTDAPMTVRVDLAALAAGQWRQVTDGTTRHSVESGPASGDTEVTMAAHGGFLAYTGS